MIYILRPWPWTTPASLVHTTPIRCPSARTRAYTGRAQKLGGLFDWVRLRSKRGNWRVWTGTERIWRWESKSFFFHLLTEVFFCAQQKRRSSSMSGKTKSREDKDHATKGEGRTRRRRKKRKTWGESSHYLRRASFHVHSFFPSCFFFFLFFFVITMLMSGAALCWCWDQHVALTSIVLLSAERTCVDVLGI